MVATATVRLEEIAREVFEVLTHLGLTVPHRRRRVGDLKEIEFLTLALLHGRGTMIVGELQRRLGVVTAKQMFDQLQHDGRTVADYVTVAHATDRMRQVLGLEVAKGLKAFSRRVGEIAVHGYLSAAPASLKFCWMRSKMDSTFFFAAPAVSAFAAGLAIGVF